jgi:protein SCO1/2
MTRREWLAALGLAPLAPLLEAAAEASQPGRKWAVIPPRERIRERYFPDVELLTHQGTKVSFYRDLIKDKLVVINFLYATCEGICPTVTHNLTRVQKLLGDRVGRDIFMYSITLKPEVDSVPVLADYARAHNIGPGWLLLTGKPADVETLRQRLGFTDPDPEVDRDKANHIGNVRYGNEPLMRWGSCPGMSDPEWILKSILWVDWPKESQKGDRT